MSRQEPATPSERFGANLLYARRQAGLSQQALGDLVGMDRVVVSALERGRRLPRVDTILRLAAGTNASTCALLDGMWWEPDRCYRDPEGSSEEIDVPSHFCIGRVRRREG